MEGLEEYIDRFDKELDAVMKFWTKFSHDLENGGFYNCLTDGGDVYDRTKYGWLQGRQVWMYAKLYNSFPKYHTTDILVPAIAGGDFLIKFVRVNSQGVGERCYFATSADGKPVKLQRKPYTECFYIMALTELYRATENQRYQVFAEEMLSQVIHWIRVDDSSLGMDKLPGVPPVDEMARPMMLLNVLTEFCGSDTLLRKRYREDIDWAVTQILKHSNGEVVREFVSPDGSPIPGCQGRLLNPGHALEAGWFLLEEAKIRRDDNLRSVAIRQFIEQPRSYGQDRVHGGLFYFLDSEGYSPVQLEWPMKLWWVHCEAMVACLMAFQVSRDFRHWNAFTEISNLCFSKFSDPNHGEWYGYLTKEWSVNQTFKGGPYKGCFHVPRALFYCLQILRQIAEEEKAKVAGVSA